MSVDKYGIFIQPSYANTFYSDGEWTSVASRYFEELEESQVWSLEDIDDFSEAHPDLEVYPGKWSDHVSQSF